uniref:Uncharacterized protein n=1 Tax=Rhizophora mucronata TaxID=61149 RepID=A0A2P2NKL5_RHIMU
MAPSTYSNVQVLAGSWGVPL